MNWDTDVLHSPQAEETLKMWLEILTPIRSLLSFSEGLNLRRVAGNICPSLKSHLHGERHSGSMCHFIPCLPKLYLFPYQVCSILSLLVKTLGTWRL